MLEIKSYHFTPPISVRKCKQIPHQYQKNMSFISVKFIIVIIIIIDKLIGGLLQKSTTGALKQSKAYMLQELSSS